MSSAQTSSVEQTSRAVRSAASTRGGAARVVILGPGASGKSTLARRLGEITGLPVVELDKVFWLPGLAATPRQQWIEIQQSLIVQPTWIMDGDLGPYDAVEVRLRAADTVIFLDFPIILCAWRALLRSRERWDFWRWLLRYPRARMRRAIADYAPHATVHIISSGRTGVEQLCTEARARAERG